MEERGLGAVQILGLGGGIERTAAEGDHPPAGVGDREHDAVAEAVVGRPTVLGLDQHARLDQGLGLGALGDQVVLQPGAAGGGVAEAEAAALALGQAAPVEIGPRAIALGPTQLGLEPLGGFLKPLAQA